jgi:hypothetical protein
MPQSGLTKEAYDVYSVINSRIFICTYWFYSHNEPSAHGHKLFKIKNNLELCFARLWSVNLKQQYCEYLRPNKIIQIKNAKPGNVALP